MTLRHLAIVMPAYNEAEGIEGFVDEIRAAVAPLADTVSFHIADDRSTDATASTFDGVADTTVVVAGWFDQCVPLAGAAEAAGRVGAAATVATVFALGLAALPTGAGAS